MRPCNALNECMHLVGLQKQELPVDEHCKNDSHTCSNSHMLQLPSNKGSGRHKGSPHSQKCKSLSPHVYTQPWTASPRCHQTMLQWSAPAAAHSHTLACVRRHCSTTQTLPGQNCATSTAQYSIMHCCAGAHVLTHLSYITLGVPADNQTQELLC